MALKKNVRLRLEAEDGSTGREYRINDGKVEVRSLRAESGFHQPDGRWHRLTSRQLSIHVERNTVVAQWLEHRLGWRRLLQSCVGVEMKEWSSAEDRVDTYAA